MQNYVVSAPQDTLQLKSPSNLNSTLGHANADSALEMQEKGVHGHEIRQYLQRVGAWLRFSFSFWFELCNAIVSPA
jgi:hypothetical protein